MIDITLRDAIILFMGSIIGLLASDCLFGDIILRFLKSMIKFPFKLLTWRYYDNKLNNTSELSRFYDINQFQESRMAMNCNIDTYWMNFGYWEKRRDDKEVIFPQACSRMAGKLAEAVNMQPGNRCLDIGFGCGDQDIWWHQHYGVDIIAVEVVPSQVAVAKRRVRDLGLEKRVQLMLGSADDLNFARATFDKIVSLDSAYHYRTREVFFSKAYALLRPGGSLGLIDFVFNNRKSSLLQELVKTCASKFFLVPKANMVSMDTYALQMKSAGFCNVRIVDLSEHVFNGFYEYSVNQYKRYSGLIAPRAFIQLRLVGMAIKFVGRYTNIKCILATGDKLSSK